METGFHRMHRSSVGENVGSGGGGACGHHSVGRAEEMLFTSQ